jgi:tetratricopeptide (TPR) repeat protein
MTLSGTSFPFTEEEDLDGAMYVWFIFGQSGCDYLYTRARDFPRSQYFERIAIPQPADVAWWKEFMAMYRGNDQKLLTAKGEVSLKLLEKKYGKVIWYRYNKPVLTKPARVQTHAPQSALATADLLLTSLSKASSFPPEVNNDYERDQLRKEWESAGAKLEALRNKYPDDPQVLRRVGVCFRMGYNLGISGAWEKAEAYLIRTEQLLPETADAYISLGILYADSSNDYAELAEMQFRKALHHARKEQLPQIWWGLALALHYQGKSKEAVETIDQLIVLQPKDQRLQQLRRTFLQAGSNK